MTPSVSVYLAANLLVLGWSIVVAVRAVQGRQGTPPDRLLAALAAMLVAPAAVVAVAASTLASGRAIYVIEWLWPATLGLFAAQAGYACWRGRISRWFAVPAFALNLLLFAAALARLATVSGNDLPPAFLAFATAHAGALGLLYGPLALASPLALQAPVLVPLAPTTWRLGKSWRTVLGLWCAAASMVIALEYVPSVEAVRSYAALDPRDETALTPEFPLGLRILPTVASSPSELALREDLALADSLRVRALGIVITPRGATGRTLDSLSRALQRFRRDSTLLVVSLGYDKGDRHALSRDPDGYSHQRLVALEEIVRRLRPDVVFPALEPHAAGARALGDVSNRWWRAYLREGSATAKRIRPRTRVGYLASAFTPADSELFAWAAAPSTALDVVGFAIRPSFGGGASLEARYRAAERWTRDTRKPLWIVASGAYPRLAGERNQEIALRASLRWAERQPRVAGLLVDGSGDHEWLTGLRAPGGRVRRAAGVLVGVRGEG